MTMTPYEIGRITGQLRAPLDAELSVTMAEAVAHGLGMEGDRRVEFLEGYQNGFLEAKKPQAEKIPNPSWALTDAELDEAEQELADLEASIEASRQMVNDEIGYRYY